MAFIKINENFKCDHCGIEVVGNGYTNHCPHCLWSRHVDNDPGDRLNECGGMLEPIGIETKGINQMIIHKCVKCGTKLRCKTASNDNIDEIILLSQNPVSF